MNKIEVVSYANLVGMDKNHPVLSRRNVLKYTSGAVGSVALTGLASGSTDDDATSVYNVGFETQGARRAAINAASSVVREFNSIPAVTIEIPDAAAENLATGAGIRYVEENGTMEALDFYPWGINRIGADVAHNNGYTGSGAHVAVIDTGIESDHPDLEANLGYGGYAVACSGSGCNYGWDDDNGHGTHCAGTVGAALNGFGVAGVAPDVTLHAVKVLDANGSGSYSNIAAGIEWTADQGWDVGSLSLGGGYSSVVHDACTYAYNNGVLLSAAAGNSGCYGCVGYPAALDECIAVSATDQNDNLASFSSYGPEIELAAPGVDVWSTYIGGGYDQLNGTSMACPHVSGAAAQLMSLGYSNTWTRSRLQNTAEDLGHPSYVQGHGLVNVRRALGL